MSLPFAIQLGAGITIGAGVGVGANITTPSFTLDSGDINSPFQYYSGYSAYSASGFTSDGTQVYNGIGYNITPGLRTIIFNAMVAAGMNTTNAYVWNVSWATGGTSLARVGLDANGGNTLVFSLIDQADTQWQTGSDNGPTQTGTFTFPADFTPYSPLTQLGGANNWC